MSEYNSGQSILDSKKEKQEDKIKQRAALRPRRSALPRFNCETNYNLTEFLNNNDELHNDDCQWNAQEKERVLNKQDSMEQLTKNYIK